MVKNTLIFIISKEENRRSVEFQVFCFTIRYGDLLSIWNCTKKDYLSQRGLRKVLGKRQQLLAYLAKKIEYVIKN